MPQHLRTLTDYEQVSLSLLYDLANGHAYHELPLPLSELMADLQKAWITGSKTSPSELERALQVSFAALIGSQGLLSYNGLLISPTASNSTDIVGAYMAAVGVETLLLEPTFDNLALLFRRRGAAIRPLPERTLTRALSERILNATLDLASSAGAIFIVNPNNPTGQTLDEADFRYLCEVCELRDVMLVVDNSFRLFNRNPFDDYAIMRSTGVSFIAFEDTGKCLPTQDLKLSIMVSSEAHAELLREIYRELYLGPSLFAMALFRQLFEGARQVGLAHLIWDLVDARRHCLRQVLRATALTPQTSQRWSPLPVEWIRLDRPGGSDLELCRELSMRGLGILPGRHFFWSSVREAPIDDFVRISLLKPAVEFDGGLQLLRTHFGAENNRRELA